MPQRGSTSLRALTVMKSWASSRSRHLPDWLRYDFNSRLYMAFSWFTRLQAGGANCVYLKEKTMRQTRSKTVQEEIIICDRCHREMAPDDANCEHHERIAIRYRAGYGSVFGDGNLVEADLCQHCLQEVLGKYLRITQDDPFDPQHKLSDEASNAYQDYQLQQIIATENFLRNLREAMEKEQSGH